MKKLNSINCIRFKGDKVYLDEIPIAIGINILDWLKNYSYLLYEYKSYINDFPEYMKCEFLNYNSIIIRTENDIVIDVSVYLYLDNTSPYFKGDVYFEGKKLELPFLSNDIEKYFSDIKTKRPTSKVVDRFIPNESIDYPINEMVKIEISMSRSPTYVGSLSLKEI